MFSGNGLAISISKAMAFRIGDTKSTTPKDFGVSVFSVRVHHL